MQEEQQRTQERAEGGAAAQAEVVEKAVLPMAKQEATEQAVPAEIGDQMVSQVGPPLYPPKSEPSLWQRWSSRWQSFKRWARNGFRKPVKVTEEMGVHKQWYEDAGKMTMDKLPAFVRRMAEGYAHDYGTVCHAVAAAAVAAAWSVARDKVNGGISGFQAGAVMWEFIAHWGHKEDKPLKLVDYSDMLYPQYRERFEKVISQSSFKWLREQAKQQLDERLAEEGKARALGIHPLPVHPDVLGHWRRIAAGGVPFGYQLSKEE